MSAPSALLVRYERIDGALVARIAINGATALNVVDEPLMRQAATALDALTGEPGLRCILFAGRDDRAFIGGANLKALGALTPASAESFIRSIHDFSAKLMAAPVPSIALMRGYCLGAGLEIAAACDIRIGDPTVHCGMPEVRVGVPSVIEAALLPGLIGWGKTRELLLRGHIVDATESLRIGLLQSLVASEALEAEARAMARDIVAGAPGAIALQKRLFCAWQGTDTASAIEHGVEAFVAAYAGDEPSRYVAAFFEARAKAARAGT